MSDNPMEDVLGQWKTAFDSHRTDVMASLFTPDALFQGFGPTVLSGQEAIRGYYDAVPDDRSADVTISTPIRSASRRPADSLTSPSVIRRAGRRGAHVDRPPTQRRHVVDPPVPRLSGDERSLTSR